MLYYKIISYVTLTTKGDNMVITTNLHFTEEEKKQLSDILSCDIKSLNQTLEEYSAAALEEYCRMILGQKVFTRIKDIREYRIYLLIRYVFQNTIPDEQKISRLFQTTPNESASLIRSITSKYQYDLKKAIRNTYTEIIKNATNDPNNTSCYIITTNSKIIIEKLNIYIASIDGTLPQISKRRDAVSSYNIMLSSYKKLKEQLRIADE